MFSNNAGRLRTFTGFALKEYLIHCYKVIVGSKENSKTVHHLCASHMLRDYMRKMGPVNVPKRVRFMAIKAFAPLQNSITITESMQIFEEICYLFLSERRTERCAQAEIILSSENQTCSENTDEIEEIEVDIDDDCHRKQ